MVPSKPLKPVIPQERQRIKKLKSTGMGGAVIAEAVPPDSHVVHEDTEDGGSVDKIDKETITRAPGSEQEGPSGWLCRKYGILCCTT